MSLAFFAEFSYKKIKIKKNLGVIRYTLLNILSKYSSLISHRPSMFEGRHINHRSSKVDTSIIGLRRSTHPSPKVDTSIFESLHIVTSIFEGQHIDLRRATHQSSKVDTSIIDLRKSTHRSRRKHHTYNSS